jgi:phospholipase D1/2
VFNLRSYDRLNTTPAIKLQDEIMGSSTRHTNALAEKHSKSSDATSNSSQSQSDDSGDFKKEQAVDQKRKFEDQRDAAGLGGTESGTGLEKKTSNTVAQSAMLNTKSVSEEYWIEGAEDLERENFVQEELYIHAKVMIVDDKIAICGSSNINDRSQIGTHDSELSIVIEDTKVLESKMDGKPFQAGYLPATLRRRLWREHLGLLPPQDLDGSNDPNAQPPGDSPNDNSEGEEYEFVEDPLSDKVWDVWTKNATTNTEVFKDLFHSDPDNSSKCLPKCRKYKLLMYMSVKTFDEYQEFTPNPKKDEKHKQGHIFDKEIPVVELKKQLDRIKGHLVWMPLDFLCEAEMAEKGLQLNAITESVYT